MNILDWIVPREREFFRMLMKESRNIVIGTQALESGFTNGNLAATARRMKSIEENGDDLVHNIFAELNRTFITPIDREDISSLTMLMDDVLDSSYEAATCAEIYEIGPIPLHLSKLTSLVARASAEMDLGIRGLEKMNADEVQKKIIKINELESRSEEVMHFGLKELFKARDPITVIKLKDIYGSVGRAMDRCEDVSHVLGDIVMKHR